jgi:SAM-dependent methyltransferase
MTLDISDLRTFYASPLGGVVRRIVSQRIRKRWRRVTGEVVMGLGYASPYLGSFRSEVSSLGALMPADMGGLIWPPQGAVHSVLVEDERLPLADASVDRLIVVHCLEASGGHARGLLREAWRILAPEGRMILVVPNRRGPWARRDGTPFGHGQPYSRGQLERLLRAALFIPIDWDHAIFLPPFERRMLMRSARVFERVGRRLWPLFSGVLIVEARKEVARPLLTGARAKLLRPVAAAETVPAQRTEQRIGPAEATSRRSSRETE